MRNVDKKDIAILSLKSNNHLQGWINSHSLLYQTTTDIFDNDRILATSSRRFKVLESEVVIVVGVEKDDFADVIKKANMYVAASRAKKDLYFIINNNICSIDDIAALSNSAPGFSKKGIVSTHYQVKVQDDV